MQITSAIETEKKKSHLWITYATQIFVGSLLIALCARITIFLPFTPVPLTLQTLAVMMIGATLGSRRAVLSVILYIGESVMGFPVLHGGLANPLALIGPNGGYLIGFIFQAYLVGWFAERRYTLLKTTLMLGMSLACCLQLILGTLWLGHFVGYQSMLIMGVIPFIPGEILKMLIVTNFLCRNDTK